MRTRAAVLDRAARMESAKWEPGDRIPLSAAARSIAPRTILLALSGVENADRYDERADVATGLMHANNAAVMLMPVLRRRFAGLGPWARLVRLRARFDELLIEQMAFRRPDTADSS